MKKIIIIGGVGTSLNIAQHLLNSIELNNVHYEFLGFAIDDENLKNQLLGFPILCKPSEIAYKFQNEDIGVIYSLYRPDLIKDRAELLKSYKIPIEKFINYIHSSVFIPKYTKIGYGNVILSNSSIMNNVEIGNFNILNANVVVEHDTKIGNYNFIAAHTCIGSKVVISNYNFIGLNSSLRENVTIGDEIFIGMGSNVLTSICRKGIYFGNPAKCKC